MNSESKKVIIDELRSKHRTLRKLIDDEVLLDHAEKLQQRVTALPEYQSANHVAAYIAIFGEISLEPIIRSGSAEGKVFYLPILRGESMAFAPWQVDRPLLKKKFGLLEPDCSEAEWLAPDKLDLVLTPLVVFDDQCNRIGQGGGYYDRTFEFTRTSDRPALIGVAHESQREPALSPQIWDIPLHRVITEQSVYSNAELKIG